MSYNYEHVFIWMFDSVKEIKTAPFGPVKCTLRCAYVWFD